MTGSAKLLVGTDVDASYIRFVPEGGTSVR